MDELISVAAETPPNSEYRLIPIRSGAPDERLNTALKFPIAIEFTKVTGVVPDRIGAAKFEYPEELAGKYPQQYGVPVVPVVTTFAHPRVPEKLMLATLLKCAPADV